MSNKNTADDYNKYISSIHKTLITPEEIIRDIVKQGTGIKLLIKDRIIAGEVNEVYDITLSNKRHVILRISRQGYPNFQQEKWAITECKRAGVPVPEILLIKYVTIKNKKCSICLMEKIDGEPLERGGLDFEKLNLETRKRLIRQAGEILSRIHSIETRGFGWIIGEGKAEYSNFENLLKERLRKKDALERIIMEEGMDKNTIRTAFRIINRFADEYAEQIPKLNHGDYSHKHFMVKDNKITGILDWGSVRSDSPVYDFSTWDYWFGDYIPTEWLKEGYQDKSLFDSNFEDFLHMLRIFNALDLLEWYYKKNQHTLDKVKETLLKDLEYFK
ncbi:MAG: hypothetical protein A2868_00885 [Candidatus Levybacteria bacterium RIFCSPHIGHO2_01_FULL_40_15b]|nr:MAG: hypothetical protein A2868_00885 [Candidatus Levybacteria bacterium RIFCSPHIGHO2_01_FULL_40_15b]